MKYCIPIFLIVFLVSCEDEERIEFPNEVEEETHSGFQRLNSQKIGIDFLNYIEENEEQNHLVWDAVYYGGGVAIGDFNNDGWQDLFYTGNQVNDAIYINNGDMTFTNVTKSSGLDKYPGWSNGVSLIDINSDGNLDIYVCRSGWLKDSEMIDDRRNKLFVNNGDLTFTEKAADYGLDNEGYSTQATWLDYDKDGDLDMFLLNAPSNNISQKVKYNDIGFPDYSSDKLFRNEGDGSFTDVSELCGVEAFSYGLGVIAKDFNHDGWIDLYVANDYERPDYMYINQRNGTFENQLNDKIKHTCYTAMGVDAGDINNDCLVDFSVLDMQSESHFRSKTNMPTMQPEQFWSWVKKGYNHQYMSNVLQINNGVGYFSDISQLAGVASTDWSWSVIIEDYDDDSYKDIYITNGINRDIRNNDFALNFEQKMANGEPIDLFELAKEAPSTLLPNYFFHNNKDLTFTSAAEDFGVAEPSFSFGAAIGDLDNDGDLDLVVNNNNMSPFIFQNEATKNYLNIKIKGENGNPFGLGVKAVIFYGDNKQYKELTDVRGYQSSSEPIMHFGLGNVKSLDSVLVLFPDNSVVKKFNVKANALLTINSADSKLEGYDVYQMSQTVFSYLKPELGFNFRHTENQFNDFDIETLLPHKQTTAGPFISKADVNNDGLDDYYIGGAFGQSGALFLQDEKGVFIEIDGPWQNDAKHEDMGIVFFDLDNDSDLDMYVVSGGGQYENGSSLFQDRLYINNGNAKFSKGTLPEMFQNGSCVKSCDFDNDGDVDLFIGGRGTPGNYPQSQESFLLINENGILVKNESQVIKENCGLVTDAEWVDIDSDNDMDLVVVGEWMTPTIFENNGSTLVLSSMNSQLSGLSGWWYCVSSADLDGDGTVDLVLGNIGENNKFHVSEEKPLRVYESDIDGNETNDIILAKIFEGKYVPVRGRECSSGQVPQVSEDFEDFESFASASIEDVYGDKLGESFMLEVNNFKSGVLKNLGGSFQFVPFPNEAQISPIMDVVIDDFDQNGTIDILIGGNMYNTEVETARYDAGNGLLLEGLGSMEYTPVSTLYSGFYIPENVKSMMVLDKNASGQKIVLIGANNNKIKAFTYK